MKNIQNKSGFALVVGIGLVLVMSLMAFFILDYMVPFGKNIKGIENSTNAYYQAENGIEDALFTMKNTAVGYESGSTFSTDAVDSEFNIVASGSRLPPLGEGNSGFDRDWNKIRSGEPIQLEVGSNIFDQDNNDNVDNISIIFRVPDLDGNGVNTNENLSGATISPYTPIINWQLTSSDNTLNASGSWITNDDINKDTFLPIVFSNTSLHENGVDLDGTTVMFSEYYKDNCKGNGSGCILKLSIINKLELDNNNIPVPYIEWILNDNTYSIPLRYSHIKSSGKSYGFKKDLKIKVPQQTVNEAFDFTVFQ